MPTDDLQSFGTNNGTSLFYTAVGFVAVAAMLPILAFAWKNLFPTFMRRKPP